MLNADTIHVPGDYPTIQQAIDVSVNGDTILVSLGIYYESIKFNGKGITVRSAEGPEVTFLIPIPSNPAILVENDEGPDTVIDGFTIKGGNVSAGGAAIHCQGSSPTILNNIITENNSYTGSAISCNESSATIEHNKFSLNFSASIDCREGGSPIIENNYFYGINNAAVRCHINTSPIINKNIIYDCNQWGILCDWSNAIISNNVICYSGSSGIRCNGDIAPKIINNTILANLIGIVCDNCSPIITNTILWANYPEEIHTYLSAKPVVSYCDVMGGYTGSNNIDLDPQCIEIYGGDLHIAYNSPCRDAGDNNAVTELYDFEGDPRIAWNGTVDIGADEFYTHLYCTGDFNPDGSIEGKLIGLPGTTPTALFIGTDIRETPVPTPYGDFYLLPPRILVPLTAIPANGVLSLPTTVPTLPGPPYDIPVQGLVGLDSDSLTNLCVLEIRALEP